MFTITPSLKSLYGPTVRQLALAVAQILILMASLRTKRDVKSKRILTVLKVDAIGDFFMWTTTASDLRKRFPKHHLRLVCSRHVVELARSLDIFDEVVGIDVSKYYSSFRFHIRTGILLRRLPRSEVLVQFTCTRGFWINDVPAMNLTVPP